MKKTILFIGIFILALLLNIHWEWHISTNTTNESFYTSGPLGGVGICAILCAILIYRTFLAIQDFLIAKQYLLKRVRTEFDSLPLLLMLPLAFQFTHNESTWTFKWGSTETTIWYFATILVTIFLYQIYITVKTATELANKRK